MIISAVRDTLPARPRSSATAGGTEGPRHRTNLRATPRAEFGRGTFVRAPADSPTCGKHISSLRRGSVARRGWQTSLLWTQPGRENSVDGAVGAVLRCIAHNGAGTSWLYARTSFTTHAARAGWQGAGVCDLKHGKPVNRASSAQFASGGRANAPDRPALSPLRCSRRLVGAGASSLA